MKNIIVLLLLIFVISFTSCGGVPVIQENNPNQILFSKKKKHMLSANYLESRSGVTDEKLKRLKTYISHGVKINPIESVEKQSQKKEWIVDEKGSGVDLTEIRIFPEKKYKEFKGDIMSGDEIRFVSRSGRGMYSVFVYQHVKSGYILDFKPVGNGTINPNDHTIYVLDKITNIQGNPDVSNFNKTTILFSHDRKTDSKIINHPSDLRQ